MLILLYAFLQDELPPKNKYAKRTDEENKCGEVWKENKPRKCDPVKRVLAWRNDLSIDEVILVIGSIRLTVVDLWTVLLPHEAMQYFPEPRSINGYFEGWLTGKVPCS